MEDPIAVRNNRLDVPTTTWSGTKKALAGGRWGGGRNQVRSTDYKIITHILHIN